MEQRRLQLTSNELKLIALVAMTIDHVGSILFPKYLVLRIIGRIAFPIFAYMIAEGCRYTSNRLRYFLGVFLLGVAMQLVFWYTRRTLYQHVLITFSLSILLIYSVQEADDRGGIWYAIAALVLAAEVFICLFLKNYLPKGGFRIDYGICGVMLPLLIYLGRSRTERVLAAAAGMVAVCITMSRIEWYSLLAIPLLALYNGKRGNYRLKYLFYVYYPLHLLILETIRLTR